MSKCPTCERELPKIEDVQPAVQTRANLLEQIQDQRSKLMRSEARLRADAKELVRLHEVMDSWEIGLLQAAERGEIQDDS